MDWTLEEGYGIPIGIHYDMNYPKEISLVSFPLHLSLCSQKIRTHCFKGDYNPKHGDA